MKNKSNYLVLALILGLLIAAPALAASENLTAEDAWAAQTEVCDLDSTELGDWNLCEQYIYEFAHSAATVTNNEEVNRLVNDIVSLLTEIANLVY